MAGTSVETAEPPPHALEPEEAARRLATDLDAGLSDEEARARLGLAGPNRLPQPSRPAYGAIAAGQLADPLVALLVAATAVSFAIGDRIEGAAIAAIVVLNAVLGFVQEAGAERAVLALRRALEERTTALRSGSVLELPAAELVPGDIVVLGEGDRVPADGRLVAAAGLAVDESALTGESVPVDKSVEPVPAETPLAERTSMAFAGTGVTRGRGRLLVTATGSQTELGRVAGLTAAARPPATPLQRRVRSLVRLMVVVGVGVTLALAGAMLARGASLDESFLVGVSVAVAAVPEGLAATVTIALALGARAMAERGAIVRRLTAVETLGSTTVIASDKTGTLTENRLRVARVLPAPGRDEAELLAAAALASTARVLDDGRTAGDPVDGAVVLAAHERGLTRERLDEGRRLWRELPFDPERRRMTLVYEEPGGRRLYVKGAPEVVLGLSGDAGELERRAGEWAAEGLRVLAVAEGTPPAGAGEGELERDLQAVGLVGLEDPLRQTAGPAVARAREAGLRVEIVTGDHPATAAAIGRELGLSAEAVHARVAPAEKLQLVERLQGEAEVVAVTGDGVNDAPALRRADVGVAMGRAGTEAAREAADLVLTDDDFATIVVAIEEGRRIGDNVRKFVAFLLSANLGEVALFAIAIPAGLGVPMTVVQVLIVNVLTDGLPALALTRDPPSSDLMRRAPDRSARLFPPAAWAALAGIGLVVGGVALCAYLLGDGASEGQTLAFATVALSELALVYSVRSPQHAATAAPRNRILAGSVVLSAGLVLAALYVPALHEPLGTVALGVDRLAVAAGLALVPFVAVETAKGALRRLGRSIDPEHTA